MAIKKWKVRINYLSGCEFINVIVKANSERKAKIIAKEKVKKERGDHFMEVCSCRVVDEECETDRG